MFASCNTSKSPLFGKRSAHQKYAESLESAGLKGSQLGNLWFNAATKSLNAPDSVVLPFQQNGFFAAEIPAADGFVFKGKRGQKIMVNLSVIPDTAKLFFCELWQVEANELSLLTAMDTLNQTIEHVVKKDGQFIVRIQPQLLVNMEYTISFTTGPSLAFPVQESGNPRIISTWGVDRDGGQRRHEGIDIQAKFRTPAVAATEGIVSRVGDNNLGGKVIFLRDRETGNSLYYAHLDSQIAVRGQSVQKGDVIGLIGNTGNAKNTVPHLHFGIYAVGGAIDPLVFVDKNIKKPAAISSPKSWISRWVRTNAASSVYRHPYAKSALIEKHKSGTPVLVLAALPGWLKVQLPGGNHGYISDKMVTDKSMKELKVNNEMKLLALPDHNAPGKFKVGPDQSVSVIGNYGNFSLVTFNDLAGWMMN